MAHRKAEKEIIQTTKEKSSSPAATDAPVSGSEVPVLPEIGERSEMQSLGAPSQVPGSLSVPIILEDKEEAVEPIPPAKKEIVMGLRAASAVPISRARKRKCVAPVEGGPPLPEGLRIAPVLRGKFISLIDGMIGDCSTEAARLARELREAQGQLSEIQGAMTALTDSCTAKVSSLEGQVGELERDLGKTASALIKEKKTRKVKGFGSLAGSSLVWRFEEDSLLARRSELGSVVRTFELLLSDLRSECVPDR
ncbi:Uncharacterized protein Rs2_41032 [Raphanus sativus]|nr:Uncharacterized protein Rs2_41032 [Raphanus sativus]